MRTGQTICKAYFEIAIKEDSTFAKKVETNPTEAESVPGRLEWVVLSYPQILQSSFNGIKQKIRYVEQSMLDQNGESYMMLLYACILRMKIFKSALSS